MRRSRHPLFGWNVTAPLAGIAWVPWQPAPEFAQPLSELAVSEVVSA